MAHTLVLLRFRSLMVWFLKRSLLWTAAFLSFVFCFVFFFLSFAFRFVFFLRTMSFLRVCTRDPVERLSGYARVIAARWRGRSRTICIVW